MTKKAELLRILVGSDIPSQEVLISLAEDLAMFDVRQTYLGLRRTIMEALAGEMEGDAATTRLAAKLDALDRVYREMTAKWPSPCKSANA